MSHVVSVSRLTDTDSQPRYHREGKSWHGGRIRIKMHLGSLLFERPHPMKGSRSRDGAAAAEIARWEEQDFSTSLLGSLIPSPQTNVPRFSLCLSEFPPPFNPIGNSKGISKSRFGLEKNAVFPSCHKVPAFQSVPVLGARLGEDL